MKLIVIGSGSDVNIRLKSQFVSGYHAELLLLDNGEILLTDKGSKNGTFLNDKKLQPNVDVPIKRGDVVRFADQTLDWRNVPATQMPDLSKIKEMRGIGTNFRNKYQLQGDRVSRFHATLTKKSDSKWYIQDHSKNGTTINGKPIPSNQDIKLKKGDKILCAGVPVSNPCGDGAPIPFKKILMVCSIVLLLFGGIFGVLKLTKGCSNKPGESGGGDPSEIYAKYKNSTVLIIGYYHYKVSAGNLPLEKLGLPTELTVTERGEMKPVRSRNDMKLYTGTGFYISKDGKIVTNLHIVRPWLFDEEITQISDKFKMLLSDMALEMPRLNAFISQVKVEGVLDYIGMIPNGAYFSDENLKTCRELVGHDNVEKDVAIIQLDTKRLPDENCEIVDMANAVVDDSEILVGSKVYTMGYPFGLGLQDLKSSKGIRILWSAGDITQECGEYSFGFNAPSYHGASGSPVFNNKGQLIGVLNSGISKSQGYNFAIKAAHVKELFDQCLLK